MDEQSSPPPPSASTSAVATTATAAANTTLTATLSSASLGTGGGNTSMPSLSELAKQVQVLSKNIDLVEQTRAQIRDEKYVQVTFEMDRLRTQLNAKVEDGLEDQNRELQEIRACLEGNTASIQDYDRRFREVNTNVTNVNASLNRLMDEVQKQWEVVHTVKTGFSKLEHQVQQQFQQQLQEQQQQQPQQQQITIQSSVAAAAATTTSTATSTASTSSTTAATTSSAPSSHAPRSPTKSTARLQFASSASSFFNLDDNTIDKLSELLMDRAQRVMDEKYADLFHRVLEVQQRAIDMDTLHAQLDSRLSNFEVNVSEQLSSNAAGIHDKVQDELKAVSTDIQQALELEIRERRHADKSQLNQLSEEIQSGQQQVLQRVKEELKPVEDWKKRLDEKLAGLTEKNGKALDGIRDMSFALDSLQKDVESKVQVTSDLVSAMEGKLQFESQSRVKSENRVNQLLESSARKVEDSLGQTRDDIVDKLSEATQQQLKSEKLLQETMAEEKRARVNALQSLQVKYEADIAALKEQVSAMNIKLDSTSVKQSKSQFALEELVSRTKLQLDQQAQALLRDSRETQEQFEVAVRAQVERSNMELTNKVNGSAAALREVEKRLSSLTSNVNTQLEAIHGFVQKNYADINDQLEESSAALKQTMESHEELTVSILQAEARTRDQQYETVRNEMHNEIRERTRLAETVEEQLVRESQNWQQALTVQKEALTEHVKAVENDLKELITHSTHSVTSHTYTTLTAQQSELQKVRELLHSSQSDLKQQHSALENRVTVLDTDLRTAISRQRDSLVEEMTQADAQLLNQVKVLQGGISSMGVRVTNVENLHEDSHERSQNQMRTHTQRTQDLVQGIAAQVESLRAELEQSSRAGSDALLHSLTAVDVKLASVEDKFKQQAVSNSDLHKQYLTSVREHLVQLVADVERKCMEQVRNCTSSIDSTTALLDSRFQQLDEKAERFHASAQTEWKKLGQEQHSIHTYVEDSWQNLRESLRKSTDTLHLEMLQLNDQRQKVEDELSQRIEQEVEDRVHGKEAVEKSMQSYVEQLQDYRKEQLASRLSLRNDLEIATQQLRDDVQKELNGVRQSVAEATEERLNSIREELNKMDANQTETALKVNSLGASVKESVSKLEQTDTHLKLLMKDRLEQSKHRTQVLIDGVKAQLDGFESRVDTVVESCRQLCNATASQCKEQASDAKQETQLVCSELKSLMHNRVDDALAQCASLSQQVSSDAKRLRELLDDGVATLHSQLAVLADHVDKQRSQLEQQWQQSVDSQNAALQAKVTSVEEQVRDAVASVTIEKEERIQSLRSSFDQLREENDDAHRAILQERRELNEVIEQEQDERSKLNKLVGEAKKELAAMEATVESRLLELTQQVDERLDEMVREQGEQGQKYEEAVVQLRHTVHDSYEQVQRGVAAQLKEQDTTHRIEAGRMESGLKDVVKTLEMKLNKVTTTLSDSTRQLEQESARLHSTTSNQLNELDQLVKENHTQVRAELQTVQSNLRNQDVQLKSLLNNRIQSLTATVESWHRSTTATVASVSDSMTDRLQTEVGQMRNEQDAARTNLTAAINDVRDQFNKRVKTDVTSIHDRLNNFNLISKSQTDQLESVKRSLHETADSVYQLYEQSQSKVKELEAQLLAETQRLDHYAKSGVEELSNRLTQEEIQRREWQQESCDLIAEARESIESVDSVSREVAQELREKNSQTVQQLYQLRELFDTESIRLNTLQNDSLHELREQHMQLKKSFEQQLSSTEESVTVLQSNMESLRTDTSEFMNRAHSTLNDINKDLSVIRREADSAQAKVSQKVSEVQQRVLSEVGKQTQQLSDKVATVTDSLSKYEMKLQYQTEEWKRAVAHEVEQRGLHTRHVAQNLEKQLKHASEDLYLKLSGVDKSLAEHTSQRIKFQKTLSSRMETLDKAVAKEAQARLAFQKQLLMNRGVATQEQEKKDEQFTQALMRRIDLAKEYTDSVKASILEQVGYVTKQLAEVEHKCKHRFDSCLTKIQVEAQERTSLLSLHSETISGYKDDVVANRIQLQEAEKRLRQQLSEMKRALDEAHIFIKELTAKLQVAQEEQKMIGAITEGKLLELSVKLNVDSQSQNGSSRQRLFESTSMAEETFSASSTPKFGSASLFDQSNVPTSKVMNVLRPSTQQLEEWYKPSCPNEPLDVAVYDTLRQMKLPIKIPISRIQYGVYQLDKKCKLCLGGTGLKTVLIRRGGGYESLASYVLQHFTPLSKDVVSSASSTPRQQLPRT